MITLRPATMNDAQCLFDWRNDPLTRANSVNSDPVEWSGHVAWLERRLSRDEPGLFVAVEGDELVGTVRIDDDEISYTVSPDHRGRGLATAMLMLAYEAFGQKIAKIKPENRASIRAAEKAGHQVELI